ncbi:MAG: IS701 family transposase [Planctomycetota bacterium]|nr:IS701 family transposase [Planctomycetota bacterium]
MEGIVGDCDEPVLLHRVDETLWESLWDHLVREYHYLGYDSMIGRRIKYLATMAKRPIGAISFCSACYKLGPRDMFVGWDEATRIEYLPHLLNNNRFLILPWIKVRNLASRLLALSIKRVREDWERQYAVKPYMVETFVDRQKFSGTSYMASNWTYLGLTKGFGRVGNGFTYHGCAKALYVIVINSHFKHTFNPDADRLPSGKKEILNMMHRIPDYSSSAMRNAGVCSFGNDDFNDSINDYLSIFKKHMGRKENFPHFIAVILGILSDEKRKNIKGIASACLGPDEVRNVVNLFGKAKLDDSGMLDAYQKDFAATLSHPDGMITGDGCDFPKKGKYSVGVARQYCGRLGKVENCQASVAVGYCSKLGHGLYDANLYLPAAWFDTDHAKLREECGVPESLEFKTKNQMLSEMINDAHNAGRLEAKYVGVDCSFGRDPSFLDSVPEPLVYFADVPWNQHVFLGRPAMIVPEYRGRGRRPNERPEFQPRTVKDIVADPAIEWEEVVLGMGSKGPTVAKDKCIKVVEVRDGKPGKDVWLYARRMEDGSIKYSLCNESMDATKDMVRKPALMRWSIEQCFRECKESLGMDHYEARSWTAWNRHILFVFIAHLFLNKLGRKFVVKKEPIPGPTPLVISPVPVSDYREAVSQLREGQPLSHPFIRECPEEPEPLLTMGMVLKLIRQFIPKIKNVLEEIEKALFSEYMSFRSFCKSVVFTIMGEG